ncbi:LysM peptidoglycan-binding domain-containing protein [Halobacillus sp. A1]|uniref:3D domain-containing protein n=1 Tax=Halobacillus sp. A1 TaxID=2880262 RepID=UPI0020A643FA|nr:LysM peptidoglycan-binding and 3D domain-containing protein [Halobacillus sp. A1]MCP3030778.1 LysM peptidoglycan-binding domain-containing protein [Halobacillus sp. A1]
MKKTAFSLVATAALTGAFATGVSAEEYKVNKGDTLWSISEEKGVSVDSLKENNKLDSNVIYPDQTLSVSGEQKSEEVKSESSYTVKSGDTLYGISKEYGVSVDDLKGWNDLSNDTIYPDDKLTVSGDSEKETSEPKEESSEPKEEKEEPAEEETSEPKEESAPAEESSNDSSEQDNSNDVVKEVEAEATAYTANCEGCTGVTATGIDLNNNPDQKVIAVDPDVIPLGSKVYVEGYGTAIAGDTGGAIQGNRIDLYMQDRGDALDFGRQNVTVQVLAE